MFVVRDWTQHTCSAHTATKGFPGITSAVTNILPSRAAENGETDTKWPVGVPSADDSIDVADSEQRSSGRVEMTPMRCADSRALRPPRVDL